MGSLAFLAGVVEAVCVTRYRGVLAKHDSRVKICSDVLTGGCTRCGVARLCQYDDRQHSTLMSWQPLPRFCVRGTRL